MEQILLSGWIALMVAVGIRWWRVCIPVALSSILVWEMAKMAHANFIWYAYGLLVFGFALGVFWQTLDRGLPPLPKEQAVDDEQLSAYLS